MARQIEALHGGRTHGGAGSGASTDLGGISQVSMQLNVHVFTDSEFFGYFTHNVKLRVLI